MIAYIIFSHKIFVKHDFVILEWMLTWKTCPLLFISGKI